MERYLRVNLLGPGPRLMKKEFTGPRSHKGSETVVWGTVQCKNGKVFASKSVGTGPSSYEKRIYRAAVSQRFRNTGMGHRAVQKWKGIYE